MQELNTIEFNQEDDEFVQIKQYIRDELYPNLHYYIEKAEESKLALTHVI
jgi:hypothetical protein